MGHLFAFGKLDYCQGDRPAVDCIFCEIAARSGKVDELELWRGDGFLVCLNLYPYNSGHLLLVPLRHVEDPRELSAEEATAERRVLFRALGVLERVYAPHGFNVGCNLGPGSGASVRHLHTHVVPRYTSELGFIDILSGSKIVVEDPRRTQARLVAAFAAWTPDGA